MPAFRIELVLHSAQAVQLALDALVNICAAEMRAQPDLPLLYASGIRYQREPDGVNRWQSYVESLARKVADCEDLAAARCAELQTRFGETRARCSVKFVRTGLWHVRVVRANGVIEDPSRVLGMGRP